MASSSSHSIPCELIERPFVLLDDLGHQGPSGLTTSIPLLLWLPVVPLAADDAGIPMLQQNAFNGHPYDPSVFSGTLPRLQLGALPLCEFGGDVNVNKRLLRVAPWPTCRPLSCARAKRQEQQGFHPSGGIPGDSPLRDNAKDLQAALATPLPASEDWGVTPHGR